jgi:hypothetical protein
MVRLKMTFQPDHPFIFSRAGGRGLVCYITHVRRRWPWQGVDAIIAQHKLGNCKNVAVGAMSDCIARMKRALAAFAPKRM